MDKLRGMETFIAVVECGSFTGAASRLGLSAVMVGKYIAQLESQLATRLLERNTRRQSLTDAGRVYFDEAKRVMEQVSIAESAVERLRLAPAGTLRVSAPTSFGASVIAPLTATFLQAWPAVRVELDLTNRMVDLVDEGFDLAIRIGEIHQLLHRNGIQSQGNLHLTAIHTAFQFTQATDTSHEIDSLVRT